MMLIIAMMAVEVMIITALTLTSVGGSGGRVTP